MNILIPAFLILHFAFGLGSLLYLGYRSLDRGGVSFAGIGLFFIGLTFPVLGVSSVLAAYPDTAIPAAVQVAAVTLAFWAFILALAAAAMVKHLTESLDTRLKRRALRIPIKYGILVLWAGAATASVSGTIRAIGYHSGYADYAASPRLAELAGRASENRLARLRATFAACRAVLALTRGLPPELPVGPVSSSWFDGNRVWDIVVPEGHARQLQASYSYRRAHSRETGTIEGASYEFNLDGIGNCSVTATPNRELRAANVSEIRTRVAEALRRLPALAAAERRRPIDWTYIVAASGMQELGFDTIKITPADARAELLERVLKWFSRLFLGGLLLLVVAPAKTE